MIKNLVKLLHGKEKVLPDPPETDHESFVLITIENFYLQKY
jgi:hypothetical protein